MRTAFIWDGFGVNDRAYRSLDDIRSQTNWEHNGLAGNPRFVNLRGLDFRIRPGSPAVDAGIAFPLFIRGIVNVTDDFAGQPRPLGDGFDRGAYENH